MLLMEESVLSLKEKNNNTALVFLLFILTVSTKI